MTVEDEFTRFEHEGWERVANKYELTWSSLTRQFIPYLIDATQIAPGMSILDVACGPGYVSVATKKLGATPMGIDFSKKMIAIASRTFPEIDFIKGEAQQLPFADASYAVPQASSLFSQAGCVRYVIAPPQLEPAPAVQPKQWSPVMISRLSILFGSISHRKSPDSSGFCHRMPSC
jgi:SAM-dependent methyltransferase